MRRHVAQPLDAGGLVGRVGLAGADVDLAGDGLVDDGLLLLLQQRTQLLLGADVAPDAPVGVVEEADDGGLFGEGREGRDSRLCCDGGILRFRDASNVEASRLSKGIGL